MVAAVLVVLGALAAQTLLLLLARLRGRRLIALLGHGLVLGASAAALLWGDPAAASVVLSYAAGFAALLLHAQWVRRARWEPVILGLVVLGLAAVSLAYSAALDVWPAAERLLPAAFSLAGACGVAALALLALPIPPPRAVAEHRGILVDVVAHGAAAMTLLNILFLAFSLVSGWSLRLVFAALFAWQLTVIGMEFRTVRHASRRRKRAPPLVRLRPDPAEPVTVVVPAANEAAILPETLEHNLRIPYPLKFVIVPAAKSTDGTVALAHEWARRHPDRVRVVEGRTGSKAEDLNVAWRTIDTRHVLLLDADETTDEASILRALTILREHPDVGVVQGRKVSRKPDADALSRFISAERRYCTWLDHVMHGETLGSSHFGGSAALLRREVPLALGGWTDRTMTEDIEFTLRVHLDDRWRIVYDPDVVVREADPSNMGELLRQRTRWARGWAQCFDLYFPSIVRAARRLGPRRAFGLTLLLLISVSALWTTLVPATLAMRFVGISPLLPLVVAIPLSLLLLPGRLIAYGYAAIQDPVIPVKPTPGRLAELALHAYLWIPLGWFVQLHALYLELSSAPRIWYVTGKRGRASAG